MQVQKNFKNPEKIVNVSRNENETRPELIKPTLTKEPVVDESGEALKAKQKLKQT